MKTKKRLDLLASDVWLLDQRLQITKEGSEKRIEELTALKNEVREMRTEETKAVAEFFQAHFRDADKSIAALFGCIEDLQIRTATLEGNSAAIDALGQRIAALEAAQQPAPVEPDTMNEFWKDFDARLARLEHERAELGDNLAAWDEIPDASEKFVAYMNTAHAALTQAIRWMKAARELDEVQS